MKDVNNAEWDVYRSNKFKKSLPQRQVAIMSKHQACQRKVGKNMTDWNDPDL